MVQFFWYNFFCSEQFFFGIFFFLEHFFLFGTIFFHSEQFFCSEQFFLFRTIFFYSEQFFCCSEKKIVWNNFFCSEQFSFVLFPSMMVPSLAGRSMTGPSFGGRGPSLPRKNHGRTMIGGKDHRNKSSKSHGIISGEMEHEKRSGVRTPKRKKEKLYGRRFQYQYFHVYEIHPVLL